LTRRMRSAIERHHSPLDAGALVFLARATSVTVPGTATEV
jgi:hypothetical protein